MTVGRNLAGADKGTATTMVRIVGVAVICGLLSACGATSSIETSSATPKQERPKEFFSEKEYGVRASPRVALAHAGTTPTDGRVPFGFSPLDESDPRFAELPEEARPWSGPRLRRGGGYKMVGKPYQIKGKWYRPSEDTRPETGRASWYGSAFHGRLTANGEVFDMNHLSAAHRTFPLPSYAKVTNMKNGRSVMVRVNDRGPFAHNRVLDVSKRTAELLGFKHAGTAEVKVEYAGPAPLQGDDEPFLLASYDNGRGTGGDALPTGNPTPVLVADAGSAVMASAAPGLGFSNVTSDVPVTLPEYGPVAAERPSFILAPGENVAVLSGYADRRVRSAAFDVIDNSDRLAAAVIRDRWKSRKN